VNHFAPGLEIERTGDARSRNKVSFEEDHASTTATGEGRDRNTQLGKVDHVSEGVDGGEKHNRPSSGNIWRGSVGGFEQRRLTTNGS